MSEQEPNVSDATRETEAEEETLTAKADREPTPEEEAAAEAAGPLDPAVAETYKHQNEVGADAKGEGRI